MGFGNIVQQWMVEQGQGFSHSQSDEEEVNAVGGLYSGQSEQLAMEYSLSFTELVCDLAPDILEERVASERLDLLLLRVQHCINDALGRAMKSALYSHFYVFSEASFIDCLYRYINSRRGLCMVVDLKALDAFVTDQKPSGPLSEGAIVIGVDRQDFDYSGSLRSRLNQRLDREYSVVFRRKFLERLHYGEKKPPSLEELHKISYSAHIELFDQVVGELVDEIIPFAQIDDRVSAGAMPVGSMHFVICNAPIYSLATQIESEWHSSDPVEIERAYFAACQQRFEQPMYLLIRSGHPQVSNALFDLRREAGSGLREKCPVRRSQLWEVDEGRWQRPGLYQVEGLMRLNNYCTVSGVAEWAQRSGLKQVDVLDYLLTHDARELFPARADWEVCLRNNGVCGVYRYDDAAEGEANPLYGSVERLKPLIGSLSLVARRRRDRAREAPQRPSSAEKAP